MPMQARTIRLALLIATISVALSGCPGPQPRPTTAPGTDVEAAARLEQQGRSEEAASLYSRSADRSTGATASTLRLQAAELWLQLEDAENVRRQLLRVDEGQLEPFDRVRLHISLAELALLDKRPDDAIARLPRSPAGLPRALAGRAFDVRARAYSELGYYDLAVQDLVAREATLTSSRDREDNQKRIWTAIRRVDPASIQYDDDPILRGWFELADVRKLAWQDPARFDSALQAWHREHPDHPAWDRFVPQLVAEQRRVATGVREIALILPLSGRFAAAAAAVRDGLIAAHFSGSDTGRRPRLRIYDTEDNPEMAVVRYREAVNDGVDFVIGPLQKDAVAALARLENLEVPVLALNTLDGNEAGPANLFQFGLVPEEEAHQIAERVALQGLDMGIALVPDNDLGLRMLHAFRQRYEELGGTLVAAELYNPQQQDHSAPIIRSLTIDESRSRQQVLSGVLNLNLQWEPRRRQDAEFIFLIGNPQQGRALRPQLRFHHASGLPVFASSHLYTGVPNRAQDSDMNGVAFIDMPWTIAPDATVATSQRELAAHYGGALERNTRLYALGYDAYRLAPVLRHDPALLSEPVPAATGALHIDHQRRIHRVLSWAHFVNGTARPLR